MDFAVSLEETFTSITFFVFIMIIARPRGICCSCPPTRLWDSYLGDVSFKTPTCTTNPELDLKPSRSI
jgi:hypothetical protein